MPCLQELRPVPDVCSKGLSEIFPKNPLSSEEEGYAKRELGKSQVDLGADSIMDTLTHLSLFTGIGGIDLAAEWAGFTTVGQCEINPYCRQVLEKNFPGIPRWDDVKKITANEILHKCGRPTLISGGFPCQPHSTAGKRKASCDSRDLWPELCRIIGEVKPRWFVGENVQGILSSEKGAFFGRVVRDLVQMGYRVGWGSWEAASVGAPHHRNRVFIVAYSEHNCNKQPGMEGIAATNPNNTTPPRQQQHCREIHAIPETERPDMEDRNNYPNTINQRLQRCQWSRPYETGKTPHGSAPECHNTWNEHWFEVATRLCRVDDGIPKRVDRFKCLGNAVVPQQVYPLIKQIADFELSGVIMTSHE